MVNGIVKILTAPSEVTVQVREPSAIKMVDPTWTVVGRLV
jgi:hypothetical protein